MQPLISGIRRRSGDHLSAAALVGYGCCARLDLTVHFR